MTVKQVIIIRSDLKMRRGKEIAQACHASTQWILDVAEQHSGFTETERHWLNNGTPKIVLHCKSEAELIRIHDVAKANFLRSHLVCDEGRTEFHGIPTYTAVAIGPNIALDIDQITGPNGLFQLPLY